ncbi:MAG: D-alanyl-D-alanine carboxypeptidase family protein [Bacillota bacterium]|nr:D-alanyl-D-alanine carboxypeptidase family protein [Bacillota bacterium]
MQRFVALILAVILGSVGTAASAAPAGAGHPSPVDQTATVKVEAPSAILVEAGSGKVLFAKSADRKQPIASLTKIMTMVLALEALRDGKVKLTDLVTGSALAKSMGGTQIWLEEGEQFSLKDMLYAIGVGSANDCAVAVAEYLGGSFEGFVAAMNRKAKELGMNNTHFSNPTGLDDADNYSTAADLATLCRYAVTLPMFLELSSAWEYWVRKGTPKEVWLTTFNKLLKFYPGYDGIKTGFTDQAGYCLASTAKRGGLRLIAVVLGEPTPQSRSADVVKLLDYGFRLYEAVEVAKAGTVVGQVEVLRGHEPQVEAVVSEDFHVAVPRVGEKKVATELRLDRHRVNAPVRKGQALGVLVALQKGREVGRVGVVAARDVPAGSWYRLFGQMTRAILRAFLGAR